MTYKFSKKDAGPIDEGIAQESIKRYQDKNPNAIRAYFYGDDIIRKVIDHKEAVGMRIYFGLADNGQIQLFLVGAREDGSNIGLNNVGGNVTQLAAKTTTTQGTVGDNGYSCPPYCP
ncbi:MAG TPA: hypothetical protein VGK59_12455 [Ohtaekwangia sp.]